MNIKKIIAVSLMAGFLGMNFMPALTFAIDETQAKKEVVKQKKLSKKEKKALQAKQNHLNDINIQWWESYNDEYLQDYIYKALANNYDLKIATLKVEEARQLAKLQLAKELPNFAIGAAPSIIKLPTTQVFDDNVKVFAIPMIASYEADIFLKNHDKTKSAKKLYEASQFQEKATYIAIASQVGATYYNIVKLDQLISVQEEIIKDRQEIVDLMLLSNAHGIVSTSDLVKAEKAYVAATSALTDYKKAREIMLNSLCVLIGESPANSNSIKRISYNKLNNIKPIPKEISSEVIMARPDYMVAQKMLERAGIDVRVAKKEFLPTIDILGLMAFSTTSIASTMNWENAIAGAGVNAMLPLFTGGAKIANFKINKNRYQQALANYQKTNLTAIQEVNDSLSVLKLDNEKYLKNVKTLKMEEKDFWYTQAKYNEGVISKLDLLQRKENLLVMQQVVTNSKAECIVDYIGLYKAVAGNI